jgi:UDP-glucuronate 4-epimerase
MKILVTGAAGFIGSHLCEKLLADERNEVIGIDTFTGPTPVDLKIKNVQKLLNHSRFQLIQKNLLETNISELIEDVDVIYHLAGMPGVRSSWGRDFDPYVTNNIVLTQRLLEVAKNRSLKKFIYASTSSVYGEKSGKVVEDTCPVPLSPYGITKLTGEHLCGVYHNSYQIPIVIVRFFTVYGPRQRPDMAFHRFIKQILIGEPLTIYGDGFQSRDFTYISDCVEGTYAVLHKENVIGQKINIGGKERASVNDVITMIEQITGEKANIQFSAKISGEPKHTWADISKAMSLLEYDPKVPLKEGLAREVEYIRWIYDL